MNRLVPQPNETENINPSQASFLRSNINETYVNPLPNLMQPVSSANGALIMPLNCANLPTLTIGDKCSLSDLMDLNSSTVLPIETPPTSIAPYCDKRPGFSHSIDQCSITHNMTVNPQQGTHCSLAVQTTANSFKTNMSEIHSNLDQISTINALDMDSLRQASDLDGEFLPVRNSSVGCPDALSLVMEQTLTSIMNDENSVDIAHDTITSGPPDNLSMVLNGSQNLTTSTSATQLSSGLITSNCILGSLTNPANESINNNRVSLHIQPLNSKVNITNKLQNKNCTIKENISNQNNSSVNTIYPHLKNSTESFQRISSIQGFSTMEPKYSANGSILIDTRGHQITQLQNRCTLPTLLLPEQEQIHGIQNVSLQPLQGVQLQQLSNQSLESSNIQSIHPSHVVFVHQSQCGEQMSTQFPNVSQLQTSHQGQIRTFQHVQLTNPNQSQHLPQNAINYLSQSRAPQLSDVSLTKSVQSQLIGSQKVQQMPNQRSYAIDTQQLPSVENNLLPLKPLQTQYLPVTSMQAGQSQRAIKQLNSQHLQLLQSQQPILAHRLQQIQPMQTMQVQTEHQNQLQMPIIQTQDALINSTERQIFQQIVSHPSQSHQPILHVQSLKPICNQPPQNFESQPKIIKNSHLLVQKAEAASSKTCPVEPTRNEEKLIQDSTSERSLLSTEITIPPIRQLASMQPTRHNPGQALTQSQNICLQFRDLGSLQSVPNQPASSITSPELTRIENMDNIPLNGPRETTALNQNAQANSASSSVENNNNSRYRQPRKIHKCEICNKEFRRLSLLTNHKVIHTGERPFACDSCSSTFVSKFSLSRHKKVAHTIAPTHECKICKRRCASWNKLKLHEASHTKPFLCAVCGKGFALKSTRDTHALRHTGVRPFACSVCDKTFLAQNKLTSHMRGHTGDVICPICSKSFSSPVSK